MFFISYAPTHKPVSSRTLSRWISDILHKAVIVQHRHHGFSGGLSRTETSKAAGWTNVKTFGEIL